MVLPLSLLSISGIRIRLVRSSSLLVVRGSRRVLLLLVALLLVLPVAPVLPILVMMVSVLLLNRR
jgi:hypothetical protein